VFWSDRNDCEHTESFLLYNSPCRRHRRKFAFCEIDFADRFHKTQIFSATPPKTTIHQKICYVFAIVSIASKHKRELISARISNFEFTPKQRQVLGKAHKTSAKIVNSLGKTHKFAHFAIKFVVVLAQIQNF
jgi:hypothetical protein